jgi:hypothetical protein
VYPRAGLAAVAKRKIPRHSLLVLHSLLNKRNLYLAVLKNMADINNMNLRPLAPGWFSMSLKVVALPSITN